MYQGILYYNSNGNLIQDLNKKISEIQYNCLNLPNRIEFEDGGVISYLYDAKGTKFRTMHIIAGKTTTTDYFDDAIYENGVLTTLLTGLGYISLVDGKYHYYPFGGTFLRLHLSSLTSITGRSWIDKVVLTGMIMGRDIMIRQ